MVLLFVVPPKSSTPSHAFGHVYTLMDLRFRLQISRFVWRTSLHGGSVNPSNSYIQDWIHHILLQTWASSCICSLSVREAQARNMAVVLDTSLLSWSPPNYVFTMDWGFNILNPSLNLPCFQWPHCSLHSIQSPEWSRASSVMLFIQLPSILQPKWKYLVIYNVPS